MSRSYKRHAVYKDKNCAYSKRQASRTVRRHGVSGIGEYKKHYCSWNICDHRLYEGSFEENLEIWRRLWQSSPMLQKQYPDWKRAYRSWVTFYKSK